MPAIQTQFSENIRAGVPGHVPDMTAADVISRTISAAGGVAFGVPLFQGATDRTARTFETGDSVTDFLGVSMIDRSAVGTGGNAYAQYESARILKKGPILVIAAVAVAAGDPVTITTTGAFSNTGGITIPGARWDTSTAAVSQLAQIFIK